MFPTLGDLRGLPDPQLQYRFTLIVPTVPGGGDGRRLQFQCQGASIPGQSNEKQTVTTHGIDLHFMGRQKFSGTMSLTFYETRDHAIADTLRSWLNYGRDCRKGSGSYKADYAVTAELLLLDDALNVTKTFKLIGAFPEELSDSQLEGGSSAPVTWSVTMSYDAFTEN